MIASVNRTAAERAKSLHALSEAAREEGDIRTAEALTSAAKAWERVAGPGVPWSFAPLRRDLACLKRDLAEANGPFKAPEPPKSPPPAAAQPDRELRYTDGRTVKSEAIVF